MIITYYGKQFFKLQHGDFTLAINPLSKDNTLGIKPAKFGSQLALSSLRHKDFNGFEAVTYNGEEPFLIYGPGSYEIKGYAFDGFASEANIDGKSYINTIYFFTMEDISVCFLGDIFDEHIDQKVKEFIETVDVIFVPIGGKGTLDPIQASKVIRYFSPKVIIPMDFGKDRDPKVLDVFLKEMSSHAKEEAKYVFKKKDLETLNNHVVLLKAQ